MATRGNQARCSIVVIIMELEQLPEDMQEAFRSLKFNSASIECDIHDALESTDTLDDFQDKVSGTIDSMIAELENAKTALCGGATKRRR